jgi:transcriptional regulator with XRE-family HTH domain
MANQRPTKFPANSVGPQIRRLRVARDWSQAKLALRLQLSGLDIRRDVLGQIEAQLHCLNDTDIIYFARALGVREADLFASFQNRPIKILVKKLL